MSSPLDKRTVEEDSLSLALGLLASKSCKHERVTARCIREKGCLRSKLREGPL